MASKLGPHSLRPTADAKRLVQAGSRLVKMVDDFGAVPEYLAINPTLTIIGRGYVTYTLLQQLESGATPSEAARHFVLDQKVRYYDHNPLIKIWEGHNEPSFGAPNDKDALKRMEWYGQFEVARLKFMADLGLRGVVGNFSTGYPEIKPNDLRMWNAFLPALEACQNFDGLLGLHEYSAPWIWWMTGDFQRNNCPDKRLIPGWRAEDIGALGWTTLRYRQIYKYALAPVNLDNVPLVITEMGADAVGNNCPGTPSGVWRDLMGFWNSYDGARDPIDYWRKPERDGERYYAEQLIWYDREIQKDAYVLGATLFTFGASSATWEPYRIDETRIPGFIANYIKQSQIEPTLPLPPLHPAPVVTPSPTPADAPTPAPAPTPTDSTSDSISNTQTDSPTQPPTTPTPAPAPAPAPSIPNRGQPREQYSRIYVLLPPNATDPVWVDAIAQATWQDRRFTIGASADDAGLGNLHARLVVAINPQAWGTTPPLDQWFAKNYPGVTYGTLQADTPADLAQLLQTTQITPPIIAKRSAPSPALGVPQSQYARTYVLMNPDHTDPAWVSAVAHATWDKRVTIGGSADDAGIGDLNNRRVLILNPTEGYVDDIFNWFTQNYPGVQTIGIPATSPSELETQLKQALA